jgi:hypothetical protein
MISAVLFWFCRAVLPRFAAHAVGRTRSLFLLVRVAVAAGTRLRSPSVFVFCLLGLPFRCRLLFFCRMPGFVCLLPLRTAATAAAAFRYVAYTTFSVLPFLR